jgi:hypothetical protein
MDTVLPFFTAGPSPTLVSLILTPPATSRSAAPFFSVLSGDSPSLSFFFSFLSFFFSFFSAGSAASGLIAFPPSAFCFLEVASSASEMRARFRFFGDPWRTSSISSNLCWSDMARQNVKKAEPFSIVQTSGIELDVRAYIFKVECLFF